MTALCLGIETSCDETAVALVAGGRRILANVVASQWDLHARYGGVVPELASRRHLERLLPCLEEALAEAGVTMDAVDLVAVTKGPGLIGSLMVGVTAAKTLALLAGKPLVGVHHLAGHIHSCFLAGGDPEEPSVCLVISGGHTSLYHLPGDGSVHTLGATRDDAAGEAFDKVARLLDLGHPGGPAVDRLARTGNPEAFPLPRAMLDRDNFDFSFSGLKTAVLYTLEDFRQRGGEPPLADLAASFQQAVVDVLVAKTVRAAKHFGARQILLAGGVAANSLLRRSLEAAAAELGAALVVPPLELCTDNAAMIAAAGHYAMERGRVDDLLLEAVDRLPLREL